VARHVSGAGRATEDVPRRTCLAQSTVGRKKELGQKYRCVRWGRSSYKKPATTFSVVKLLLMSENANTPPDARTEENAGAQVLGSSDLDDTDGEPAGGVADLFGTNTNLKVQEIGERPANCASRSLSERIMIQFQMDSMHIPVAVSIMDRYCPTTSTRNSKSRAPSESTVCTWSFQHDASKFAFPFLEISNHR